MARLADGLLIRTGVARRDLRAFEERMEGIVKNSNSWIQQLTRLVNSNDAGSAGTCPVSRRVLDWTAPISS
jgi:hypothetical protein